MHDTLVLRSTGPDDTRAIAAEVASQVGAGDAVSLSGELGAGKTCFVQGATWALGYDGRVTSPTFTLVREYPARRMPVVHVDVYRLDRVGDVLELGEDVLADDVVTLIEWGDAIASLLPDDRLDVEVVLAGDTDAHRLVRLSLRGSWRDRSGELARRLAAWRVADVAAADPRDVAAADPADAADRQEVGGC